MCHSEEPPRRSERGADVAAYRECKDGSQRTRTVLRRFCLAAGIGISLVRIAAAADVPPDVPMSVPPAVHAKSITAQHPDRDDRQRQPHPDHGLADSPGPGGQSRTAGLHRSSRTNEVQIHAKKAGITTVNSVGRERQGSHHRRRGHHGRRPRARGLAQDPVPHRLDQALSDASLDADAVRLRRPPRPRQHDHEDRRGLLSQGDQQHDRGRHAAGAAARQGDGGLAHEAEASWASTLPDFSSGNFVASTAAA